MQHTNGHRKRSHLVEALAGMKQRRVDEYPGKRGREFQDAKPHPNAERDPTPDERHFGSSPIGRGRR